MRQYIIISERTSGVGDVDIVSDGVAALLMLVSACTISVGFKILCDHIKDRLPAKQQEYLIRCC